MDLDNEELKVTKNRQAMELSKEEQEAIEYLKSRLYGNEGCKFIDVAQEDLRIFLNLLEKLQKENEKQSKVIDETFKWIKENGYLKRGTSIEEIKQYFYRKAEEDVKN